VPLSAWQLSLIFWRELIQLPALYYRAKQSFPHSQHMALTRSVCLHQPSRWTTCLCWMQCFMAESMLL
jgi:hypothetical protein